MMTKLIERLLIIGVIAVFGLGMVSGLRQYINTDAVGLPLDIKYHIECPRCHNPLMQLINNDPPHRYECRKCGTMQLIKP